MEEHSSGHEFGASEKSNGSGISRSISSSNDTDSHGAALLLPAVGASKAEATETRAAPPRSLWVVGSVQTIATFLGVLGAIVTVLFVKTLMKQQKALPATSTTGATAAAKTTATVNSADRPATDSATLPFRVVGADSVKGRATLSAEMASTESPVKSVFDQNVELLETLNNLPQQKAA